MLITSIKTLRSRPRIHHSLVHIIVIIQVFPVEGSGIVVLLILGGLMQVVQDSVHHPANRTGVLTARPSGCALGRNQPGIAAES